MCEKFHRLKHRPTHWPAAKRAMAACVNAKYGKVQRTVDEVASGRHLLGVLVQCLHRIELGEHPEDRLHVYLIHLREFVVSRAPMRTCDGEKIEETA